MPFTFDWTGVWTNHEKVHICREAHSGFGMRTAKVSCEVGRTSDGSGITMTLHGTPHPSPLVLASGHEWPKPGVIEKMVRSALADAEDPKRAEQRLVGGNLRL